MRCQNGNGDGAGNWELGAGSWELGLQCVAQKKGPNGPFVVFSSLTLARTSSGLPRLALATTQLRGQTQASNAHQQQAGWLRHAVGRAGWLASQSALDEGARTAADDEAPALAIKRQGGQATKVAAERRMAGSRIVINVGVGQPRKRRVTCCSQRRTV